MGYEDKLFSGEDRERATLPTWFFFFLLLSWLWQGNGGRERGGGSLSPTFTSCQPTLPPVLHQTNHSPTSVTLPPIHPHSYPSDYPPINYSANHSLYHSPTHRTTDSTHSPAHSRTHEPTHPLPACLSHPTTLPPDRNRGDPSSHSSADTNFSLSTRYRDLSY